MPGVQRTASSSRLTRRRLLAGAAALPLAAPAIAQEGFPKDRVTIVTSLPAGSSVDITTRIFAERLTQVWKQPVVIDNRGGANGLIACELVARARPDGYTLLATSAMTHAANPALYDKLPYDALADFAAVTRYGISPFVLMVAKTLPAPTLKDFIALLKREPNKHNFGAGSLPSRIASEMFRQVAGVDIVHVGYKGNQQAFPDLTSGRISMMSVDVVGAKPLIDRDAVYSLAVSDAERNAAVPSVPTSAEAGLADFDISTWSGLYAPKGVPKELVARISRDFNEAAAWPETKAKLDALGGSRALTTPEEFQNFTTSELDRWGRIIRAAGLKVE